MTFAVAEPPFSPRIYEEPGVGLHYDDGRVFGAVEAYAVDGAPSLLILEWSSRFPSCGHTLEALRWLRPQFKHITAMSVGTIDDGVGDIATMYWLEMQERGLVDELFDDNGELVNQARLTALTGPRP